jgi:hypothetical protein
VVHLLSTPEANVEISIRAANSSNGIWMIIFDNKALQAEFENSREVHEKGAL